MASVQKRLRVIVFTQEEHFFIPNNIIKASKVCDIVEVVDNQCKNSAENKIGDMIKWFGFFQCAHIGIKTIHRILLSALDRITGNRVTGGRCSIKDAANEIGAAYVVQSNINDSSYVEHVRKLNPDLVISYSAPQVVKEPLLSLPRHGIINVHGALLPEYRGLLPSFWYLYKNEKVGGATVHYMSNNIDDGAIIIQDSVDISDCNTMFELMKRTKHLGGELIVKAIQLIEKGEVKSRPNNLEEGSYFTWPTVEQAKEFRLNGKRLV